MKNLPTFEQFVMEHFSIKNHTNLIPMTEDNPLSQTANITRNPSIIDPDHASINTDPNRTVGTGTYTPKWDDQSLGGFDKMSGWDPTDSASGGSHPVYIE